MLSIIPMNSLFVGDRIVRCATRWLTVAAALRRPNGSAIGGTPYVAFRREESFSGRPRHVVVVGKGEAMLVLPGLLESKGGAELVPKPLMVEGGGRERTDGGVRLYQLSPLRNDEI